MNNTTDQTSKSNLITDSGDVIDCLNIILPEKIDFKDLNPYESSSIHEKSEEDLFSTNNPNYFHSSSFDIDSCTTLVLPKNQIYSTNFFEQFWSPRVYSSDSKISPSILSILHSLMILLCQLFLSLLYPCLQYDTIFFGFCYLIGALLGMHAYYFIDLLLISICIISILVGTYEEWLFHYINLNAFDNYTNGRESNNRYWRQIKLAAYGLAIGTISTMFV